MSTHDLGSTLPLAAWLGGRSAPRSSGLDPGLARFDPRHLAHAAFFDAARALDRVGWVSPLSRERPSWVFYDCALMPGAFFGFALEADRLPPNARAELGVGEGQRGLVPVSMLALIPTLDGCDLVQSLAAIELPGLSAEALAGVTLADGIRTLGVRALTAAVPWRSPLLSRFLALGPLRLRTAWTPAHDEPRTATFAIALGSPPMAAEGTVAFRRDDDAALVELQRELEAGVALSIVAVGDPHISIARHP